MPPKPGKLLPAKELVAQPLCVFYTGWGDLDPAKVTKESPQHGQLPPAQSGLMARVSNGRKIPQPIGRGAQGTGQAHAPGCHDNAATPRVRAEGHVAQPAGAVAGHVPATLSGSHSEP